MANMTEKDADQNHILEEQGVIYQNIENLIYNAQDTTKEEYVQGFEQNREPTHSLKSVQAVKSDEELHRGDTSSLLEHNTQYTLLLNAYVNDFKENSKNKIKNKQRLFIVTMILLLGIPVVSLLLIAITLGCLALGYITALESLPELLAALAALLGTFMVIPKIITKYLFNKNEEKNLADIINKIQDYDRDIRGRL